MFDNECGKGLSILLLVRPSPTLIFIV